MAAWDFVGFDQRGMSGPGGASALSYGNVGGGSVQSAPQLSNGVTQVAAAPGSKGWRIPPVVWMFVLLIVGYWGVHQCLKAV